MRGLLGYILAPNDFTTKREPTMRETIKQTTDRLRELEAEIGDVGSRSPRDYAAPRYREDGHMPTVANIPYEPLNALEELQSIVLHMTYGEMVELANGISKAVEATGELTPGSMAKAIHQWATTYNKETKT